MGNIPDEFKKRYVSYDIRAGEILIALANEGATVYEAYRIAEKMTEKIALAERVERQQAPLIKKLNENILNNHTNF
jgi:hypothetical protein